MGRHLVTDRLEGPADDPGGDGVDLDARSERRASRRQLAIELANLAGGALNLAERGQELVEQDPRLACHLIEMAVQAQPEDKTIHAMRAEIYQHRRSLETSLMAKGIFGSAANESKQIVEE